MKKRVTTLILLCLAVSTTSFAAENNEPNLAKEPTHNQCPPPPRPMPGPFALDNQINKHNLFNIAVKSSNPTETIKSLISVIPSSQAKQYMVTVIVTEVPEKPEPQIKP